jgi:hypothetical protein
MASRGQWRSLPTTPATWPQAFRRRRDILGFSGPADGGSLIMDSTTAPTRRLRVAKVGPFAARTASGWCHVMHSTQTTT